jgi:protein TonB
MRTRFIVVFALFSSLCFALAASGQVQAPPSNENRKVVQRVDPTYPPIARSMNLAGTVKLVAVVAPNGKVKSVEPVGGSPVLIEAAKDAVVKWKYAPAESESRQIVEFHFNPSGPQ